jgi:Peptidase family M28
MVRWRRLFVSLVAVAGVSIAPSAWAQRSPFLPDGTYRALVNELSGDIAFEHVRWFTHYHRPMGGSEGFEAVARYVEQRAREYGLEDVRYIPLKGNTPSWTASVGELWLTAPEERRLAYSREIPLALADYSRDVDIASADLVDVGAGTAESDYKGKDVKAKVVLASGSLATVMDEAVWKRGALGIVAFTSGRVPDHADQYPWMRIPVENKEKTKRGTFAFVLSYREGSRLRRQMAAKGAPTFTVRARVKSAFREAASQAIVEAVIRGTEIHDRDIVLTGHLQEEMFSANDDASGCANVLEIARALKKAIDEGRLSRPRRDIRFWWVNEISAEEQYFADHPEERSQFLVNINQDMVGARQSAGSRVQFVTRPPYSRASFLGDVVESIVGSLVAGNTAYLAALQARGMTPGQPAEDEGRYSRPIVSRLGTAEHYDARVIPFHNNTDHQVFNMRIIGVAGVTFTNWPDDYIHSSDDDLWQIDPTQLKRNAVAVGATAYYLASFDEKDAPVLLSLMSGRAGERLARDETTALTMLAGAADAERPNAAKRARRLVLESVRRERRALESVRMLVAAGGAAERSVSAIVAGLPDDEALETRLLASYGRATGDRMTPQNPAAEESPAAARKVPVPVDDVQLFIDKREEVKRPDGLHPLMAYEALNFADGTRSYQEIFEAVAAEADAAGEWYYGTVSLGDVGQYLDSAVAVGFLTVGQR